MRRYWRAWLFLCWSSSGFAAEYPVVYEVDFSAGQRQRFESEWSNIFGILPEKIRNELPSGLSLVVRDLNPSIADLERPSCDSGKENKNIRYGRYDRFNKTIQIDYRLVEKLISQDSGLLECGHSTWYQLAQASLLHELVHAWDRQAAITDEQEIKRKQCLHKQLRAGEKYRLALGKSCQNILAYRYQLSDKAAILRLGYWDSGWLSAQQKNTRPQRLADSYAYQNPQEFLAVNMEYFLLDKDWHCRQPMLYQYLSDFFGHRVITESSCDQPLIVHYGEWPVLKMLEPSRLYRIDYVLAGAGDDLASHFGHSMFRLVICAPARYSPLIDAEVEATPFGPACLQDEAFHLVVSFRANVDDVILNYWKGLTGAYTSRPFILPYLQVKEEYTGDQLRDMVLYPLRLNPTQQQAVVNRTLEAFWSYGGDYRFINNNCAVESQDLLQAAMPNHPIQNRFAITPNEILENMQQTALVDLADPDILHVPSQKILLEKLFAIAFPPGTFEKIPVDDVMQYLTETRAQERAVFFPKTDTHLLARIAALRRLEQQIKRSHLRHLTLLARYHLHEDLAIDIAALQSPLQMGGLSVAGYGVPYEHEIQLDEEAQLEQRQHLKAEVIRWIQQHRQAEWQEYEAITRNLATLDILALRSQAF